MQLGGGMRHLKPDHIQIFDLQYAHLVSLSHNCTAFSYRAFTSVSARLYKSKGVGYNVMLNKSNTKICQKCTWFGFVTNEDFCSPAPPPPPLLGDFAKKSEKILTLSTNLVELGETISHFLYSNWQNNDDFT